MVSTALGIGWNDVCLANTTKPQDSFSAALHVDLKRLIIGLP